MAKDDVGMGCSVPYKVCPDCTEPKPEPELASDFRVSDISIITFTDDHIRRIAEHAGVTEERIKRYLEDKNDQDNDLFRAVHWVTGCYPIGKLPT